MAKTIQERYWEKVEIGDEAGDCDLWTGNTNREGYGSININGRGEGAHRYAWRLHKARPIPKGMIVRHTCDTPSCVNPHHLFLGTPSGKSKSRIMSEI